jgi:hypothetical protein
VIEPSALRAAKAPLLVVAILRFIQLVVPLPPLKPMAQSRRGVIQILEVQVHPLGAAILKFIQLGVPLPPLKLKGQATTVVSFFACMAVAFLLHLSFVFAAGAVDGLNLYVYVDNNPLKYIDPTGHGVDTIIFDNFLDRINRDKTSFVFASDDGSATIGVVVFITESLGLVI